MWCGILCGKPLPGTLVNTEALVPNLKTALHGPLLALEQSFLEQQTTIEHWLRQQWCKTEPAFYSSVDLRNAGFKLSPVDTNLFPAGFNNLNPDMMPLCVQALQATLTEIMPNATRALLIPESHSRNLNYLESIAVLQQILTDAGVATRIGTLMTDISSATTIDLPSGKKITLEPITRRGNRLYVEDFDPCFILLNNDLSSGLPDLLSNIEQTIRPNIELGWTNRLKSEHFRYYQDVAHEFARVINIDPWLISPLFSHCGTIDFMKQQGIDCLMDNAEKLFTQINQKYRQYNIDKPPFLVIKADQGTYGMAVMMIKDPEELTQLNRKQRTKMAATKGGRAVTKVIIQEGVYSFETWGTEHSVAEPVVYLLGRYVVGGFYRVHKNKGADENLNSPGMNFEPLAFNEPCHLPCKKSEAAANRFYAYGVVARLAALAAAREIAAFHGEQRG